ncbi:amidohydrolase family protein [Photobacterium damselae]|nr:amidohydrolase family protein [Photobacterium damselae]
MGIRTVLGETIIKLPIASAATPEDGIKYTLNFIEQYKDHPRITPAFAPHGPYTNTTEILQKITELSLKHDVPVMTHLAESERENQVIAERSSGLSPIKYMESIGALTPNFVGAHVINANNEYIQILKKHDVGVAHNMSANIKSAKNVIEMATIGAARALHMEDKIGSLEVGKLADVIVVDTKAPNMVPVYNPYSALVYSAYATNVKHAIVDGKLLMENRDVLTVDEEKIRIEAQKYADTVRKTVIESGEIVQ